MGPERVGDRIAGLVSVQTERARLGVMPQLMEAASSGDAAKGSGGPLFRGQGCPVPAAEQAAVT